jgi:hypothetical protein
MGGGSDDAGDRLMGSSASSPPTASGVAAELSVQSPARDFYVGALRALDDAGLPYVVGGRHALGYYTGASAVGHDEPPAVFVKPDDHRRVLNALAHAGFRTEYRHASWLAGAADAEVDGDVIDVIYGSANGLCVVDDDWVGYARAADVLGYPTRICPAEELLWTRAFVQDRDRYHGGDVAHLILREGKHLDWQRLLRRFHGHERVLLAHCVLFGYVYPTEKDCVPDWVPDHLQAAARHEADPRVRLCRGTLLAPKSYTADVADEGFIDARLQPYGPLTPQELSQPPEADV